MYKLKDMNLLYVYRKKKKTSDYIKYLQCKILIRWNPVKSAWTSVLRKMCPDYKISGL